MDNKKAIVLELSVDKDKYIFPGSICLGTIEKLTQICVVIINR